MSQWFNYVATAKILVFGLLVGAALPALFAVGMRINAAGVGGHGVLVARRRPVLIGLSWVIFVLVLVAVLTGVLFIARDFIGHHLGWYILGAKPR